MSALLELREAARARRDELIKQAQAEYRQTIRELNTMARKLGQPVPRKKPKRIKRRPQPLPPDEFSKMTARQAAEAVLRDSGPLPLVELTLEVMRRGCRSDDDPQAVAHAIRSAMNYQERKGRVSRDRDGRWTADLI